MVVPKSSDAFLSHFHGINPTHCPDDFMKVRFLNDHNLGGKNLLQVLRIGVGMPSDRTVALFAGRFSKPKVKPQGETSHVMEGPHVGDDIRQVIVEESGV